MEISDSLLGFFIFLSLVCIGITAVVVKERIRPSSKAGPKKGKSGPDAAGPGQTENYDSLGIQQRFLDQETMMSADPRISGPDA